MNIDRLTILRNGGQVRRTHTCRTLRDRTVGEHAYGVACLVGEIEPRASATLLRAALYHDASEAIVGDTPATAKWRFPDLRDAVHEACNEIEEAHGLRMPLSADEQHILRWCDMAEFVLYAIEELHMGNGYAFDLVDNGITALAEIGEPNANARSVFNHIMNLCELVTRKGK